jgi:hypothetical protein
LQKARANNTNLGDTPPENDYSNWTYTFTKEYHEIANGTNELTAKLDCLAYPSNYTKFFSVNVTGVPQDSLSIQQQQENLLQPQQQQQTLLQHRGSQLISVSQIIKSPDISVNMPSSKNILDNSKYNNL